MSNTYKQPGEVIDLVAGANLASGDLVLIGTKVGVALVTIANGATGSASVVGVHEVPKLSTDVVTQGAALYLDAANKRLTVDTAVGANKYAGYAFAAAGAGATTVLVKLNG